MLAVVVASDPDLSAVWRASWQTSCRTHGDEACDDPAELIADHKPVVTGQTSEEQIDIPH
jgi:hypothetical protein